MGTIKEEKHLFKISKCRRGISPILATLLLIVIAVAAVIVTYAWVMTFTGTQTQQAGAVLSEINTRFYNDSGTLKIEITLLNSGSANAKISKVYVGTSSTNLQEQTTVSYSPSTQIISANGGTNKITVTYTWQSATTYYFNIVTESGIQYPYSKRSS